jgi:multicomponent Na+:H+ antiporter subunit D
MTISPSLPVVIPILGATALAAFRHWFSRLVVDLIAITTALVNLVLCISLLITSFGGSIVYWFGDWFPRGRMAIGIGFLVDPAGASLAALAALLTTLGLLYSWDGMESGQNLYQPLMLIFLGAMSGFCFTADLFNLFVFFELMSAAAFALCGLKIEEPAPLQGAFNFAVTNTVGAFFTLTGIALLYAVTGALNMAQIGWLLGPRNDSLVRVAFVFIVAGFLIKAAIVPFHLWLPDAHSVAPTPVCVLFSGLMVELGLFAILRVSSVIFGSTFSAWFNPMRVSFLALGGLTALWGGFMCFAEHHLKRILAFSTISHSGLMLLAIGIGGPIAIGGWLIYVFAHAFIKSGLFFTAGILLHRLRTMSEPALHARGKHLRFTAALWFLGACGLAAAPPFATAIGESLVSQALHGAATRILDLFFFISGTLTAGTVLRVFLRVFAGYGDSGPSDASSRVDESPEIHRRNRTTPWRLWAPAAICIGGGIALTFVPFLVKSSLVYASRIVTQGAYINTMYTGSQAAISQIPSPRLGVFEMLLHGGAALLCASLLALWAVFHRRFSRTFRWPSHLEGGLAWARQLQSGQPADYVVWSVIGVAVLGGTVFLWR